MAGAPSNSRVSEDDFKIYHFLIKSYILNTCVWSLYHLFEFNLYTRKQTFSKIKRNLKKKKVERCVQSNITLWYLETRDYFTKLHTIQFSFNQSFRSNQTHWEKCVKHFISLTKTERICQTPKSMLVIFRTWNFDCLFIFVLRGFGLRHVVQTAGDDEAAHQQRRQASYKERKHVNTRYGVHCASRTPLWQWCAWKRGEGEIEN